MSTVNKISDRTVHRLWLVTISPFLVIGLPLLGFALLLGAFTFLLLIGDGGGWEALTGVFTAIVGTFAATMVIVWFVLRWANKNKPLVAAVLGALTGLFLASISIAHLVSVFNRTTPVDLLELSAVVATPWAVTLMAMSAFVGVRATRTPTAVQDAIVASEPSRR